MHNDILLTNHPLLDFVLYHIFSIILFSENGITLKQNVGHEDKSHISNPVIALYPKGLPVQKPDCSWKKYRIRQTPCFITTAYSIQLLAKTANFISTYPEIFNDSSLASPISSELANISSLQLDYCLENLKEHAYSYSIDIYAALLEACMSVTELKNKQTHLNIRWSTDLNDAIDSIYGKLFLDSNLIDWANTLELSRIANAVHQLLRIFPAHPSAKELISKTALELIHRRNLYGLFQRDRINPRTAPLGWQFHCIASLLLSYPIYPIDNILDETFSVFNQLYELSWNSSLGLFSFNKNLRVRYTAFETASIIKALSLLSFWVDSKEQSEQVEQMLTGSYFPMLSQDFFTHYHQSIRAIYHCFMNKIRLSRESNDYSYDSNIYKAPVFPNVIQINRQVNTADTMMGDSESQQIKWPNISPLYIRYPLELCINILDYLELYYQKQEQIAEEDTNFDWLNLLISLLLQQD